MVGTPPAAPSLGAVDLTEATSDARRVLLADAQASLTQTRGELADAQQTISVRDSTARPGPASEVNDGAGAPARGHSGGSGADGVGGAAAAVAASLVDKPGVAPEHGQGSGAAGLPLPLPVHGGAPADYEAAADGDGSDGSFEWRAFPPWTLRGRGGHASGRYADHSAAPPDGYNDGFDLVVIPAADDWLQAFDIPLAIMRPEGLPVPFTPDDGVHNTTFVNRNRDEMEARHWYCTLVWTQLL